MHNNQQLLYLTQAIFLHTSWLSPPIERTDNAIHSANNKPNEHATHNISQRTFQHVDQYCNRDRYCSNTKKKKYTATQHSRDQQTISATLTMAVAIHPLTNKSIHTITQKKSSHIKQIIHSISSSQKWSTLLSTYFWALPWGSYAHLYSFDTKLTNEIDMITYLY